MNYVVFEAGSRAGFSAELFFADYKKRSKCKDTLYLADRDKAYVRTPSMFNGVERIDEAHAILATIEDNNVMVFPGDELTRQSNDEIRKVASRNRFSSVKEWYYDKMYVNHLLSLAKPRSILIPQTFDIEDVFLRPNRLSAGSKGLHHLQGYCATEHINIKNEYVVDVLEYDGVYSIHAREVILRNGYDKLIKLLPVDSDVVRSVFAFLQEVKDVQGGLFTGVFHLQLVRSDDGQLYYIESSKRISGSAIVNLCRGFNPFYLIGKYDGDKTHFNPFEEDEWYRWEDFVYALPHIVEQ